MKYFKIEDGGIHWKPYKWNDGVEYMYYFYPFPNWLPKKYRYLGYEYTYYNGDHHSFGFWFFNISWNFGLIDILKWIWK